MHWWYHHLHHLVQCNLFSLWYSCKFDHFLLNNNHSLTKIRLHTNKHCNCSIAKICYLLLSICKFLKSWNIAKVGVKHQSINEFFNLLMKTIDCMCPQTVIYENTYFMFPNFQRTFYLATLTWILTKTLDFSFYFWLKIDMSDYDFLFTYWGVRTSKQYGSFIFTIKNIIIILLRPFLLYFLSYSNNGPSWSWSYGSWIYSYLCNHYLWPLQLWVRTPSMARCTWYNIMW